MKNVLKLLALAFFTACITVFQGCKKDAEIPTLSTTSVSQITTTTALAGGNITSGGSSSVTSRGICWGLTSNPTIDFMKTTDGTGTGIFSSNLTGLYPNTTYYVRAYATNSAGTAYGEEISFSTESAPPAIVTTSAIASVASTYAVSGGTVTNDGGAPISETGLCYSTSHDPTTESDRILNVPGILTFTSNMTGLTPGTTYYVRAYAINSSGTVYGNELSFTTDTEVDPVTFNNELIYGSVADIDGNNYKTIQIGTMTWMAENLRTTKYNDGEAIQLVESNSMWSILTTKGYCWYDNDASSNKEIYGALYNWPAASSGKLCPAGWHVPDVEDFSALISYLGQGQVTNVSGKMKEAGFTHWAYPNSGGTNSSGLTALPGGSRSVNGGFGWLGFTANWWISSVYSDPPPAAIGLYASINFNNGDLYIADAWDWYPTFEGMSVRCVKDH